MYSPKQAIKCFKKLERKKRNSFYFMTAEQKTNLVKITKVLIKLLSVKKSEG